MRAVRSRAKPQPRTCAGRRRGRHLRDPRARSSEDGLPESQYSERERMRFLPLRDTRHRRRTRGHGHSVAGGTFGLGRVHVTSAARPTAAAPPCLTACSLK